MPNPGASLAWGNAMALDSKHPHYVDFSPFWEKLRDCYKGEDQIKAKGVLYLPPTPGQLIDGMEPGGRGLKNYEAYKMRAVFPPYIEEAVNEMVGVMHQKPPVIELPPALEPLRERATMDGEPLLLLLRRINEAQLITGRIGLMLDLPASPGSSAIPYVATYESENIVNWDDGARGLPALQTLNLVVLNETEAERTTEFEWQEVEKYRVLTLGDADANEAAGLYQQGVFRKQTAFDPSQMMTPQVRGSGLNQIPFVFINATDLLPTPMLPPLTKLANLALAIYRGEADYRLNLFMQAQDTLVVIGGDEEGEYRVGAGASINVGIGGDAKFIGVNSSGLPEQREALQNDHTRAGSMAGQLLDTVSRMKESGAALQTRVAAQTVTLHQIALTGAEGLQKCLRVAAEWIGADPNAVKVVPNTDFVGAKMTPGDYLQLANAKAAGLPLSDKSIHARLKKDEYTVEDFEAEQELLAEERANVLDDVQQ